MEVFIASLGPQAWGISHSLFTAHRWAGVCLEGASRVLAASSNAQRGWDIVPHDRMHLGKAIMPRGNEVPAMRIRDDARRGLKGYRPVHEAQITQAGPDLSTCPKGLGMDRRGGG